MGSGGVNVGAGGVGIGGVNVGIGGIACGAGADVGWNPNGSEGLRELDLRPLRATTSNASNRMMSAVIAALICQTTKSLPAT